MQWRFTGGALRGAASNRWAPKLAFQDPNPPIPFSYPFLGRGVNFDGTNDYMLRGAALTGIANGQEGTFSCWVKLGADGSTLEIFHSGTSAPLSLAWVTRVAANQLRVVWRNAAGTTIVGMTSNAGKTAALGWFHILAAWKLSTPEAYLYVDGVNDLNAHDPSTPANDTVAYANATEWSVGADFLAGGRLNGDLAELWFDTKFIDITVAANRAKFIQDGSPVDLNENGSTPTGAQPLVYLRGPAADFPTNRGGGGGFTVTGALADSATNPGAAAAIAAASGAGALAAVGVGVATAPASAAGVGALAAVGQASAAAIASAAGAGALAAVGQAIAASVAAAAGAGALAATGRAIAASVASAAGVGDAPAIGRATAVGTLAAAGLGAAPAIGRSTAGAALAASGAGALAAVGAAIVSAAAAAAGVGNANAVTPAVERNFAVVIG